jgi:hypothetical protein
MTPILVIAVAALAVALVLWNAGVISRFKTDYRFDGAFDGRRYDCVLRFANLDHGLRCFLGADSSALYLFIASERERSWWSYPREASTIFKTDLRIPWTDLAWREKKILLTDCVWFEIATKKIYFYVASDVGDKLLIDAQRKIPAPL